MSRHGKAVGVPARRLQVAWHLEADNGAIVATDGSQGYENEVDAQMMADHIVIHSGYANAERLRARRPGCG